MRLLISILLILMFSSSCVTKKNNVNKSQKIRDIELNAVYKKFDDNRFDYGEQARDTILNRFKKSLLKTLANNEYAYFPFDSLSNNIKITSSKDKKLRLFSWDELDGGTWHIYNTAYQYNNHNKSYSGILTSKEEDVNKETYTDILHFKIEKINNENYLVKGYGTHGHRLDFYVFRLISFKDNILTDCDKCFDGKNQFVFIKPRAFEFSPIYNSATQVISYPEMEISYIDGEDFGFTKPTGKYLTLKFNNGIFIKTNK